MRTNGIYPPSVKPGIPKLGECPKGWKICRFGDVLEVVERKAILKDDAEYQLVIAKRNRGGIEPRVRLRGAEIRTKTQQLITAGDFLISRRQIIHGACGLVPPSLDGALVSNEYTTLLPKDGVLLAEYLAFFSHSLHFQQTCFHSSVGVDVEKMVFRLPKWLHHKLLLPPLPEQERIAEVLGAWDRAIGLTDRLIEAKQRLKKGLMQQLLTGRLRFPQFGKPARKQGGLPKGWKMSRIQDIARVNPSTEKPKHENCTVSFFSMADISEEGRIATEQERPYLSVTNGFTSFQDGDILVAKITPCFQNGKGAHVKGLTNGIGFGSTEFHVVRPRKVDERFLFLHTQSRPFRARGEANMIGSAGQKRVPTVFIRKYPIPLPSDEEQRYISLSLYTCDREIQLLIRKRDRLQEQKRGLMQKLLTGEVRVPVKGRKHNVS